MAPGDPFAGHSDDPFRSLHLSDPPLFSSGGMFSSSAPSPTSPSSPSDSFNPSRILDSQSFSATFSSPLGAPLVQSASGATQGGAAAVFSKASSSDGEDDDEDDQPGLSAPQPSPKKRKSVVDLRAASAVAEGSGTAAFASIPVPVNNDEDGENGSKRKISIEYIEEKSKRHITFSKRKAGIMKKAYELSKLTGTQILLLVVSETGWVYTFATPLFKPIVKEDEDGQISQGQKLIASCLATGSSASSASSSTTTSWLVDSINAPSQVGPPRSGAVEGLISTVAADHPLSAATRDSTPRTIRRLPSKASLRAPPAIRTDLPPLPSVPPPTPLSAGYLPDLQRTPSSSANPSPAPSPRGLTSLRDDHLPPAPNSPNRSSPSANSIAERLSMSQHQQQVSAGEGGAGGPDGTVREYAEIIRGAEAMRLHQQQMYDQQLSQSRGEGQPNQGVGVVGRAGSSSDSRVYASSLQMQQRQQRQVASQPQFTQIPIQLHSPYRPPPPSTSAPSLIQNSRSHEHLNRQYLHSQSQSLYEVIPPPLSRQQQPRSIGGNPQQYADRYYTTLPYQNQPLSPLYRSSVERGMDLDMAQQQWYEHQQYLPMASPGLIGGRIEGGAGREREMRRHSTAGLRQEYGQQDSNFGGYRTGLAEGEQQFVTR